MKLRIYTQDNCSHCDAVIIPEGVNAIKINISAEGYDGFIPANLPVMQFEGMNFEGAHGINALLKLSIDSLNGKYKK